MFKKLASVVIGSILLISPSVSSAQTLAELQAQVMALLAQLSALQAQINAQVSETPNIVLTNAPTPTVTTNGGTTLIEFKIAVRITNAGSDDMYVPLYISSQVNNGKGATYKIIDNFGNAVTPINSTGTLVRISGGTETMCGSYECVRISGMTSTDLQMTVTASFANLNQAYRAQLTHILWQTHTGIPSGTTVPLSSEYTTPLSPTNSTTPAITVISPNGGEQWQEGGTVTVKYSLKNVSYSANDPILIYLQRGYDPSSPKYGGVNSVMFIGSTYGPENQKDVASYTFTLPSTIASWPGLGGEYTIKVCANQCSISDQSDRSFSIGNPSSGITVTSPNGGEQWELGVMNTITWTPYAYSSTLNPEQDINPARDVTAYLLKDVVWYSGSSTTYSNIGKIVPSGKASIHWEGEIQVNNEGKITYPAPGKYHIMVVNNRTGASDISDAPFTILPKSVDLKLNGSDGPITLDISKPVKASWTTTNVARCELHNAYPDLGRQIQVGAVSTSGTREVYLHPSFGPTLYCYKSDGKTVYDSVAVGAQAGPYSLKITSPNGGEQLTLGQQKIITFLAQGLKSYSIALYKNDQWFHWIATNVMVANHATQDEFGWSWTPSLTEYGDQLGSMYKIYVTGQKADGTGYVDDKSDAPFGFATSSVTGTVNEATFSTNKPTITGTANNIGTVGISIDNGDKVYGSGNTIVVTKKGTWSHTVTQAMADGEYNVDLYSSDNKLLGSGKITIKTSGIPASTRGTYQGYMNGDLFITTEDITEGEALNNCKTNTNNNPTKTIRCTWNNKEIFKRDGVTKDEKEKGLYRGYMNGLLFITTKDITEAEALSNCKVNDKNNPKESILCVWNDKEIYRRAAPATVTPSAEKGVLKIRINGAVTATVENITQTDALAKCKVDVSNSPEKTARCTWNNADIYNRSADTSKKPTCTLKANPSTVPSGGSTTLTWTTTYAEWAKLDDGKTDYGSVNKDGSRVFTNIKKDTTYTLKVNGKERVDCTKTVKVSNSSSMGETENLASVAAALEAALQAIMNLIPEEH